MKIPDYNPHNPIEDPPDGLDAYGHLNWTVSALEDQPDGGEWIACFDAIYDENTNTILYEVVVDGGSFVDTIEKGSVSPDDIESLKDLPRYWHDIGSEHGLAMDEQCLIDTERSWGAHLDDLRRQACSPEEIEAIVEQSLDYFDRHIAGDR